jgi:hypothetical protein
MVRSGEHVVLLLNTGNRRMGWIVRCSREHHVIDLLRVSERHRRGVSVTRTRKGQTMLRSRPTRRLTIRHRYVIGSSLDVRRTCWGHRLRMRIEVARLLLLYYIIVNLRSIIAVRSVIRLLRIRAVSGLVIRCQRRIRQLLARKLVRLVRRPLRRLLLIIIIIRGNVIGLL